MIDSVNPSHYRNPQGVQIIEAIRHLPFSLGNAIKYVYRHEDKSNPVEDMKKALWYLEDFLKDPATCSGELPPNTLKLVLEGINPTTRTLVLSLFQVYFDFQASGVPQSYSSKQARLLLEGRLQELSSKHES